MDSILHNMFAGFIFGVWFTLLLMLLSVVYRLARIAWIYLVVLCTPRDVFIKRAVKRMSEHRENAHKNDKDPLQ